MNVHVAVTTETEQPEVEQKEPFEFKPVEEQKAAAETKKEEKKAEPEKKAEEEKEIIVVPIEEPLLNEFAGNNYWRPSMAANLKELEQDYS